MISIIIPMYNAKLYIEKCVKSIVHQTYTHFEVIIVDDGSNDGSEILCDELAKKDSRIRIIHKSNGGVSSARNIGLEIAENEYIMFVDSDDWLQEDMLEKLLLNTQNMDFVIGGYKAVYANALIDSVLPDNSFRIEEIGAFFPKMIETSLANSPCSKVYRRSIIGTQRFDETAELGEDFLFNLEYITKCKTLRMVAYAGYIYNCKNESSATKRFRERDVEQVIKLYQAGKRFEIIYCGNKNCDNSLEKRLCINGVNMLQLIFGEDIPWQKKKMLALLLLDSEDFINSCLSDFRLPIILEIPRWFCKRHSLIGLKFYFTLKNIGRNVIK